MKHTLHKVIILAGCFCFGSLSIGLAYRFDPGGADIEVNDAEAARHMVNILLQHYHNHPDDLNTIATVYTDAFVECLNEFGSEVVLGWQLFGTQGGIRAYVKSGIRNGRDRFQNWRDLQNAFFAGFKEAFRDVYPILDNYLNELAQAQQVQIRVFPPDQGVEDMRVGDPVPFLVGDGNGF
jgi:hypothetical protein